MPSRRTSLAQILSANVIHAEYDVERFSLDWTRVKIGEVIQVASSGLFYLIKDLENLDSEAGYQVIGSGGGGSSSWGAITGDISNQADLQMALGLKVNTSRSVNGHPLSSDVTVTKGDIGLGSVENVAISGWAGSANLATLGIITAGTWNGSVIGASYGGAGSVSGIMKANGSGVVSAASAGTDYEVPITAGAGLTRTVNAFSVNTSQVISKLTNLTSNGFLTTTGGDGTLAVVAGTLPTAADPATSIGLTATNGVATTFMRSDAAPALSQAIVPTWTGRHTFTANTFSLRDVGGSFALIMNCGSTFTANRTLTWSFGNTDRTITLSGNPTLNDWFDQSVKVAATPRFGAIGVNAPASLGPLINLGNMSGSSVAIQDLGTWTASANNNSHRVADFRPSLATGGFTGLGVDGVYLGLTASSGAGGTYGIITGINISGISGASITTEIDAIFVGSLSGATSLFAIKTTNGIVSLGDTTDATSSTTGSVQIAGGLGVAKNAFVQSITTAAPGVGSAAAWNLGTYTTDVLTAQTGVVRVTINGVNYKLLAST